MVKITVARLFMILKKYKSGVKKYKMEIFILNVVIVKYMVKIIGEIIPMSIMIPMK